jgi:hypothetical protein
MRMRRFAAILALTASATAPMPALGQAGSTLAAGQPEIVLSAAGKFGEATLDRDGTDDPMIRGRIGGKDYFVYFYGCTEGRDCTNLMLSARWASDQYTDKSMGDWNRQKRFGKAYLDADGNPAVEMNVNLFGGVSRANLEDTFDWWRLILAEFTEFYGF